MRIAARIVSALLLAGALFFARLWWQRKGLPYDEQGRYFDIQSSMVFDAQAIPVFGAIAVGCAVLSAGVWLLWGRRQTVE